MTFSYVHRPPSLQLLQTKTLRFPAASGLEYYRDTLYVFGDNATSLLMLSKDYQEKGRYTYWNSTDSVVDKDEKPDIESAMIRWQNGQPTLVGVGSMSGKARWTNYELPIGTRQLKPSHFFDAKSNFPGIDETNIEGSTAYENGYLFCNRANLTTRKNHLLLWNGREDLQVKEWELPSSAAMAGLSGLYYIAEDDLLLFTASEEATQNATEDGAIGNSYLGWISKFSAALKDAVVRPTGLLKLSDHHKAFTRQKIESVCLEKKEGSRYLLHLAADNDDGKSVLFKVALRL